MIIDHILGQILLLIFPVLLSGFFFWLFFMRLQWNIRFFGIALLPGLVLWAILWSTLTTDLVIVNPDLSVDRRMVLFSALYHSEDGQEFIAEKRKMQYIGTCDVYIVNKTDMVLALERVEYGTPFMPFSFGPDLIPPHRTLMENDIPDYYPAQNPPKEVSVQNGMKSATKYWLRAASREESESAYREPNQNLVP